MRKATRGASILPSHLRRHQSAARHPRRRGHRPHGEHRIARDAEQDGGRHWCRTWLPRTASRPRSGPSSPTKLSGFDLVFSPQKSLSLATEFAATPAEFAAFWNAVDRANDRAMRYGAQEVGWARKGAGGEDGTDPGAVGWMTFRHSTARVSGLFVPKPPLQFGKSVQASVQRLRSRPEQSARRRNWLGNAAPSKVASISPGRFCAQSRSLRDAGQPPRSGRPDPCRQQRTWVECGPSAYRRFPFEELPLVIVPNTRGGRYPTLAVSASSRAYLRKCGILVHDPTSLGAEKSAAGLVVRRPACHELVQNRVRGKPVLERNDGQASKMNVRNRLPQ